MSPAGDVPKRVVLPGFDLATCGALALVVATDESQQAAAARARRKALRNRKSPRRR